MLPAQKRETQTGMAQANSRADSVGFGRVLTSIQGLQRRLDDFSVDEVSQAEAKANTLIQQFSLLQEKLARLTALKRFVSLANKTIGEIPEERFEQVNLDGLENHPKLHAIIQASKLIRFHRLMKAAKAGADAISFDAEAGKLQISTSTTQDDARRDEIGPFTTEARPSPGRPGSVVGEPVASASEQAAPSEEKQWEFGSEPEALRETDAKQFVDAPQILSRDKHATGPQTPNIADRGGADRDPEKSSSATETNFDQRLLNDLIEAYGEFVLTPVAGQEVNKSHAVNRKSTVAREAAVLVTHPAYPVENKISPQPRAERPEAAESAAVPALIEEAGLTKSKTPAVRKVDLPAPLTTTRSDKLKAWQNLTLPAEIESVKPAEKRAADVHAKQIEKELPSARKHGDLDRQLKRIIKDYGEYDLYSNQSSGRFKTAVVAVFVLLGLVLGGLYFFKAPASTHSQPQAPYSSSRYDGSEPGARAAEQAGSGN
jgi:hypothetical protein